MHNLIVDGLFIGDCHAALQPDVDAFDVIINVTREVPFSRCLRAEQQCVRYDVLDDELNDTGGMADILRESRSVIARALDSGKLVLVHCAEGKQRSAAVIASYLCWSRGMSIEQAIVFVRQKRREAWDYGQYVHYREALEAACGEAALAD